MHAPFGACPLCKMVYVLPGLEHADAAACEAAKPPVPTPPRYTYPAWAAPVLRSDGKRGVWCRVATAAGMHARVVNEAHGVDRWFSLYDLRVESTDAHV